MKSMKAWMVIGLLAVALGIMPAAAQDDPGWTLVGAQPLSDLVGEVDRVREPILAPDGSAMAWDEGEGLCVYTFADEETNCTPWLEDMRVRTTRVSLPVWSPDSTRIAMHEPLFLFFEDSDMWTFDVATRTFENHTDDGYSGSILRAAENDAPLDHVPTWNPADGSLYFFRSEEREQANDQETGYTLELYRLPDDGDEPELVNDMTFDLPGPFALYRPAQFSPDGTRLALIALPQNFPEHSGTGVWIYDMEADTVEQVATLADMQTGVPAWYESLLVPNTVFWAGDDALVIDTIDPMRGNAVQTAYYVDLTSGDVSPLVDFSDLPDDPDLFENMGDPTNPLFQMPRTGAVSPDGSAFWYLSFSPADEQAGISQVALPPTGDAPVYLGDIPLVPGPGHDVYPTVSTDGKLLIREVLVTLEKS
jgi:hypothetical protein